MPENNKEGSDIRNRKNLVTNKGQENVIRGGEEEKEEEISPKYGPVPSFPNQRVWTRMVLILGTLVVVYFTSSAPQMTLLAKQKDIFDYRRQNVPCSKKYLAMVANLPESCKLDQCGISVRDRAVKEELAEALLAISHRIFYNPSQSVTSPFLAHIAVLNSSNVLNHEEMSALSTVRRIIKDTVGPPEAELEPTEPSFFSRMSSDAPQPPPDSCRVCHFNAILYLNDFNFDFEGGRSIFLQPDNTTVVVEPRKGRLVSWWGGSRWGVEPVASGASYAARFSFSCAAFHPPPRPPPS